MLYKAPHDRVLVETAAAMLRASGILRGSGVWRLYWPSTALDPWHVSPIYTPRSSHLLHAEEGVLAMLKHS